MIKSIFITFCTVLLCCKSVAAEVQTPQDSVRFSEYLPVRHTDPVTWVTRYQGEIDRYQTENRTLKDTSCDVLFLGSSSINLWDNIYRDMAPLKIPRRSYGGAALRDMLYNYDVIARGYHPRSIVVYVENDLAGTPEDLTVGETFDFFRLLTNRLQRDYPDIPIFILSYKPSLARKEMIPKHEIINTLLKEYASKTDGLTYVDVASCLYGANGELRKDIFKPDGLHMNQNGYDLWTAILKPKIQESIR